MSIEINFSSEIRRRVKSARVLGLLCLALILAACGGVGEETTQPITPTLEQNPVTDVVTDQEVSESTETNLEVTQTTDQFGATLTQSYNPDTGIVSGVASFPENYPNPTQEAIDESLTSAIEFCANGTPPDPGENVPIWENPTEARPIPNTAPARMIVADENTQWTSVYFGSSVGVIYQRIAGNRGAVSEYTCAPQR